MNEDTFIQKTLNIPGAPKQNSLSVCFFSHSAGLYGAERSLAELVAGLIKEYDVRCTVVLPYDGPLVKKLEAAGASTLITDYSWWCDFNSLSPEEINRRLHRSWQNLLREILPELERINPHVIFTNSMAIPWGAVSASILDKPHVWSICEFGDTLEFFLPFPRILEIIKDASNLIFTPSKAVKHKLFADASGKNVFTFYSRIDIPYDTLERNTNRYFIRKGAIKLIIAGTIAEFKGQKDAVLAVKELVRRKKEVELILAGHASPVYLAELKKIATEENLEAHVRFFDFNENIYPLLNQADILLSCSRSEAFGRTIREAMLLKKPVVGTNIGGTPEQIQEGFNGLLYEPGDYKQLADRIEYLIEHKEKIKEFGERSYQYAQHNFTSEGYQGKIYEQLIQLKDKANPLSSPYLHFLNWNILNSFLLEKQNIANLENLIKEMKSEAEEKDAFRSRNLITKCSELLKRTKEVYAAGGAGLVTKKTIRFIGRKLTGQIS